MEKKWFGKILLILTVLLLPATGAHAFALNDEGTMTLQGRITTQGTMRTTDTKGTNLKYRAGDIVSQKNTLMLEFRWNLQEILPGIQSSIYLQPRGYYDGAWDYGSKSMRNKSTRRSAGFDNQHDIDMYKLRADLFTGYIDFSGYNSFLRIGKQAFSWGEMSSVRILDGVNPLNTQGPGISMEERLIPLAMVRANHTILGLGPFDSVSLEGYWVPGFIEPTVNENSPMGGPISTTPDITQPTMTGMVFDEQRFDHDRFGIKLGFTLSDLNVNFVYYRMASDNPSSRAIQFADYRPDQYLSKTLAKIKYLPVDVYGGSFNYNVTPIDMVVRGEFAYHKNAPFVASNSSGSKTFAYTSDVVKAGIGFDKNFDWAWLNPTNQVKVTLEQVYIEIVGIDDHGVHGWSDPRRTGADLSNPMYSMIPGYNGPTSFIKRNNVGQLPTSNQTIAVINSDYMDGKIKPQITSIFEWDTSTLMLIPSVTFTNNTNWDVKAQYTHTFSESYKGMGMTRDRNEAALTINYYF